MKEDGLSDDFTGCANYGLVAVVHYSASHNDLMYVGQLFVLALPHIFYTLNVNV